MRDVAHEAMAAGERPVIQEIAPGVGRVVFAGEEFEARADGYLSLDEIIEDHGSVERYNADITMRDIPSMQAEDGSVIYADGTIGFFEDLLGSSAGSFFPTFESHKQNVPWAEETIDGVTVTMFADGYLTAASDPRDPGAFRDVPMVENGDTVLYADGYIQE